ncbi:hypothetical protein Ddye_000643 [Dipteronia dyeriana]|uniref:DUF4283 domain-containing protein n=1 Tax=Dipteronia dyeriana TaxID=168575 RepID=A0AAD9XM40_9ROSI|nr:hypothetical protein Ddye_000643 [Dipteronia dyeriana]
MEGTSFRLFKWTKDFDLHKESTLAPQWIFLPGLPKHLYPCDCLPIFATRFGRYHGTNDVTLNRSRATGARFCVEVDLTVEPVKGFSIVVSPTICIWQEARYEKQGMTLNIEGYAEINQPGKVASTILHVEMPKDPLYDLVKIVDNQKENVIAANRMQGELAMGYYSD